MSNLPGEGLAPKPEMPSQEQLEEFSTLVTDIIVGSKNIDTAPIDPEAPDTAFVVVNYNLSEETRVMIGRNAGMLFAPDTVDIGVHNVFKRDRATGTRVIKNFHAAYSTTTGQTGYETSIDTFVNGKRVKSQQDIERWALIQEAGTDEFVRLIGLSQEELLSEDSELARAIWNSAAGYSQEDELASTLTRERLEVMLEILRYLKQHPELEQPAR